MRVIVPLAFGKRGYDGARIFPAAARRVIDGVPHQYVRYFTLSRFGANGFNARQAIRAVSRLDLAFIPDVIHAHTLGFDSEIGAWLKARFGCPLVVTTHGSDTSIPAQNGQGKLLKRYADRADAVVCVSSALKAALERERVGAPLLVILNGYASQAEECGGEKTRLALNQTGNLIESKRNSVTIRAFARLRAAHPEAVLSITGQGPERPALEKLCDALGVADGVRFLGRLDNREAQAEMRKAQFFVMPSVREGFGIVYLEAMAAGCVTIGTEGEGIADLIRSGENGFLVPPDDPDAIVEVIERCLRAPEEAAAIAERGRRAARTLTWEHNAKQYIGLFERLTEKGTAKGELP